MSIGQKVFAAFAVLFTMLTFISGLVDGQAPFAETRITSAISSTATTIPVTNSTGFPSVGYAWVGQEYISYSSVNATNLYGASRGLTYGSVKTKAAGHVVNTKVKSNAADLLNSLLGYNIGTASSIVGPVSAAIGMSKAILISVPRMVMWDYSFLEGDLSVIKYLILYPISTGFIISFGMLFFQWLRGIFLP